MSEPFGHQRGRHTKIVATLGPASATKEVIRALFDAGADMFRLNFSHGAYEGHRQRVNIIREIEKESGRPIPILADLQGPKLRVGNFANGKIELNPGQKFKLDLNPTIGNTHRV